jgi:Zn-dependent protease
MKQSVRLGTVRGIAVGIHWSVILILALLAWELAEYELPARPGHAGAGDWVAGVVGAVVLLLSLFVHEVSHTLVARRNGIVVRSITLFVFGGVTQLEGEAHTPRADTEPGSLLERAGRRRGSSVRLLVDSQATLGHRTFGPAEVADEHPA